MSPYMSKKKKKRRWELAGIIKDLEMRLSCITALNAITCTLIKGKQRRSDAQRRRCEDRAERDLKMLSLARRLE